MRVLPLIFRSYNGATMRLARISALLILLSAGSYAAPRQHTIFFGKSRTVQLASESGASPAAVRDLFIDGKAREHTTGAVHEVTDRYFVVRRAVRVNDGLAGETKDPLWIWQLSGWISIDRQSGRVSQINLPAFDDETSNVSWYRDYVAYCGVSDDGSKSYMMVAVLRKRKPILKKEMTASSCPAPHWERTPTRVTFTVAGEKTTFAVHARGADLQPETTEEEGPQ
jgi:hypothetical protein